MIDNVHVKPLAILNIILSTYRSSTHIINTNNVLHEMKMTQDRILIRVQSNIF